MTKAWILTIPLLVSIGCRRGEQQVPPADLGQDPQQPDGVWEEYGKPGEKPGEPGQTGQMEPMGEPGHMGQMGEPGHMGQMGEGPATVQAPGSIEGLNAVLQEMRASRTLAPTAVPDALRTIADALAQLQNADAAAPYVDQLRAYADQLQAAGPDAPEHTNLTRSALQQGMAALEAVAAARSLTDFTPRVDQIRLQVESIQVDQPLAQQTDALAGSLQQIVDTITWLNAPPSTGTQ